MLTNHFPQDPIQQTHFAQQAMFEPKREENEEAATAAAAEREVMFEKPLTPSDVGKLNRLVIPKQHAEKHFPLGGGSGGGESGDKGLVLSFEDESGKLWRFRYSYWNSSQSYVLTKGWSRFVKEKKLESGDTVLFLRCRYVPDRLYIGWKRRTPALESCGGGGHVAVTAVPWSRVLYNAHSYPTHPSSAGLLYVAAGGDHNLHAGEPLVDNPATPSNSKRVRLFGVNLDCPPDRLNPDGSCLSSRDPTGPGFIFRPNTSSASTSTP